MIFDISDSTFKTIFDDEKLHLPLKWTGVNFSGTLESLFKYYINRLEKLTNEKNTRRMNICIDNVKSVCGLIRSSVQYYLDGFPSKAYDSFDEAMKILMQNQLKIYQKSASENIENIKDDLDLYRVVCVWENTPYNRSRVFHTPYTLRSKVSTNRYSIAGYPSLYLATNIDLCCEEIHYNPHASLAIAARYKLERNEKYNNTHISVIELAVKPQDFFEDRNYTDYNKRSFGNLLNNSEIKKAYLLWYPLIAACSYIRPNKSDPFAAEYIVPQLLMQWVRIEIAEPRNGFDQLIGIRYFSCASIKASDMGFNYVFPVSGKQKSSEYPYCPVLMKAFKLTKPHFLSEYYDMRECERDLRNDYDMNFIDS